MFETLGTIFSMVFIEPILNILVFFHNLYVSVGIPGAFGFAIITITVVIRLLLHPFFQKQMKTASVMKELKPQLDALQKKYKKDAKKLQKEQLKLYQEAGVNPASGCLFAIVQMPLIFGLYQTLRLFLQFDKNGDVIKIQEINNKLYFPYLAVQKIDPHFFMYNLAVSPSQVGLWYYYLIPILTAGLQFWQSKVTMTANPMTDISPVKDDKKKDEKDGKKESSTSEEFQKAMGTQMRYFFPIMIGYFSYTLPVGLSIYWNTFSLFSIIQHYMSHRKKK